MVETAALKKETTLEKAASLNLFFIIVLSFGLAVLYGTIRPGKILLYILAGLFIQQAYHHNCR